MRVAVCQLNARDDREANLATVRQNDRVVVSLAGRNLDGNYHEVALLDLLPAGFEIESVVNDETVKNFPFLSKVTGVPMVDLAVQVGLDMPLADLGYGDSAKRICRAVEVVLKAGRPRTPDLGGDDGTRAMVDAIIEALQ